MERIQLMKWAGTGLVLSGIFLTNLNIFPLNIFIHGTGSAIWTWAGYLSQDRALMVNFGMQLPLFATGFAKAAGLF